MEISIFGVFWIFMISVALIKKPKYLLYLVVASFVFQSNWVLIVGGIDLNCSLITCLIFIINSYIKNPKLVIPKWGNLNLLYSFYTVFISIVAPLLFTGLTIYNMTNDGYNFNYISSSTLTLSFSCLTQPLAVLLYTFTAITIYKMREEIKWDDFEKFFRRLFLFVLSVGIIHVLLRYLCLPYGLLTELLHNEYHIIGATYFDLGYNGGFTRLMSTFYEPSFCGGYLAMCLMFFICGSSKKKITYIVLAMIGLLLNMSSTGFGVTAICLFLYLCYMFRMGKVSKKLFLFIVSMTFIGVLITFVNPTIRQMLYSFTIGKPSSGSAKVRMINNNYCLDVFKQTYGIGVGVNSVTVYSLAYALLSQVGVIGTTLYILFVTQVYKSIHRLTSLGERQQTFYLFTGALSASLLSCSALNLCIFWMSICIFSLADRTVQNKNL